MNDNPVIYI